jgi:hypothetical protein
VTHTTNPNHFKPIQTIKIAKPNQTKPNHYACHRIIHQTNQHQLGKPNHWNQFKTKPFPGFAVRGMSLHVAAGPQGAPNLELKVGAEQGKQDWEAGLRGTTAWRGCLTSACVRHTLVTETGSRAVNEPSSSEPATSSSSLIESRARA